MVENLSFLTPFFSKLREVGKGEKRENTGKGRRLTFLSPTSKKKPPTTKSIFIAFKREIFVLVKQNEGHFVYCIAQVGQLDAHSYQKSLSPQEGTLAQGVASGEDRKKQKCYRMVIKT